MKVALVSSVVFPIVGSVLGARWYTRRRNPGDSPATTTVSATHDDSPDLLSTVSHELRTPLTSIRGALDLVTSGAMGGMSEDVRDLVRIASENSDRLMVLVNDLLELRKIESGCSTLRIGAVSPVDVVREVVRVMDPIAAAHEVTLESSATECLVHIDKNRIVQVLLNLAHNAVRHSPRRGIVSIGAEVCGNVLTFTVDDEGPGVPSDMRGEIFKPFSQVEQSTTRGGPSTGLGLSISQRIAAHHGGTINVDRSPVGGARFVLCMPADCRSHLSATAS